MQLDVEAVTYLVLASTSGLAALAVVAAVRSARRRSRASRLVVVARCPRCGYTTRRGFREGDYVGAPAGMRCPRCGAEMIVDEVFYESVVRVSSRLYAGRRRRVQRKT